MTACGQDHKHLTKEYIELTTQKTGVFFTTRKLKNFAVEYQETVAQYKAKQSKLVSEIVSIASAFYQNGAHVVII